MNIKYDKIGFRLAKRRKKLKYTQPQLAEIVGISKNHISQFENGGSVSLDQFYMTQQIHSLTIEIIDNS